MNRIGMPLLLIAGLGLGIGVGATQHTRPDAEVPASAQATDVEGRETEPSEGAALPAELADETGRPLPSFLADEEAVDTQMRQLEIYYARLGPQSAWTNHMPQLLAEMGSTQGLDQEEDDPPYSPAELEAFRQQLDGFTRDLDGLLELFPSEQTLDARERLAATIQVLPELTDEQLALMRSSFADYPGYWDVPSQVRGMLEPGQSLPFGQPAPGPVIPGLPGLAPEARPTVPVGIDVPDVEGCGDFGGDPTCGECPAPPAGGIITIFSLETAALATNTVCEFLPPKILAGTTDIPNPANIICVSIRVGIELAAAAVELAQALHDECEDNYHRSIVHWYLDETVSSRASQKSHDFHDLWTLRVAIEHDLLNQQDQRISLFQLPESEGGYLDATTGVSVRGIVLDTIEMNETAGYIEDTRYARDEYEAAEEHLADGDYKSAYARYRLAYRAAVQVGRILPTPVP